MHTGILDVLGDGILDHLALVGHGIELNLLGLSHELGHHYGELLRHLGGHREEAVQLLVVVAHGFRSFSIWSLMSVPGCCGLKVFFTLMGMFFTQTGYIVGFERSLSL